MSAWLIEARDSLGAFAYWMPDGIIEGGWCTDRNDAVRFCRKLDADRVAETLPVGMRNTQIEVREHHDLTVTP